MPSAAIDACCLIDLLTTEHAKAILQAAGLDWHVPTAVESEVRHVRRYDASNPGQILTVPVDLSILKTAGLIQPCAPSDQAEQDRFIQYAARFRSDGEAMCLAIAEHRGWIVATDDRKAIRVAQQAGLSVLSSPALLKKWFDRAAPDRATLEKALRDIQTLAQFTPNATMPDAAWWTSELAKSSP